MMSTTEIRRARLIALIAEYGSIVKMGGKTKLNANYISQLKNGHASFGEKIAREIERKTKKPPMWLDGEEFSAPEESVEKQKIILRFVLRMIQEHQIAQQQFYPPEVFEKTVLTIMDLLLLSTQNQTTEDPLDDDELMKTIIKLLPNL